MRQVFLWAFTFGDNPRRDDLDKEKPAPGKQAPVKKFKDEKRNRR